MKIKVIIILMLVTVMAVTAMATNNVFYKYRNDVVLRSSIKEINMDGKILETIDMGASWVNILFNIDDLKYTTYEQRRKFIKVLKDAFNRKTKITIKFLDDEWN